MLPDNYYKDDREWFHKHPKRRYRIRRILSHELADMGIPLRFPLPTHTLVFSLCKEPGTDGGVRTRRFLTITNKPGIDAYLATVSDARLEACLHNGVLPLGELQ